MLTPYEISAIVNTHITGANRDFLHDVIRSGNNKLATIKYIRTMCRPDDESMSLLNLSHAKAYYEGMHDKLNCQWY